MGKLSFIIVIFTSTCSLAQTESYWAIAPEPAYAYPDNHLEFWVTRGDDAFQACTKTKIARVTLKPDGPDQLKVSLGPSVYATGRRVEPFACSKDNLPLTIRPVVPGQTEVKSPSDEARRFIKAVKTTLPTSRIAPRIALAPETRSRLENGDEYVCKGELVEEKSERLLQHVPILSDDAKIYPGALIQGKDYAEGFITPITLPRGGGEIIISGVNIPKSSKRLAKIKKSTVSNAINELLRQPSQGTPAEIGFSTHEIFNADQLAYALGLDGRYNNDLRIENKDSANHFVLTKLTQVYYHVSLSGLTSPFSVFEKGRNFEDEENRIKPDSPPLYVKSVGYGRIIYFLAKSKHDSNAIQRALKAAEQGKDNETVLSKGRQVPLSKILQESTVSYIIRGGKEIPIIGDKYAAIKKLIADERVSQVTESNKGLPVEYNLSYLTNVPAQLGFSTAYSFPNCSRISKKFWSFDLDISCIDKEARITILDASGQNALGLVFQGESAPHSSDLGMSLPDDDKNYILRLELKNGFASSCLHFSLTATSPDGRFYALKEDKKWEPWQDKSHPPVVRLSNWEPLQWKTDYRVLLNRNKGVIHVY